MNECANSMVYKFCWTVRCNGIIEHVNRLYNSIRYGLISYPSLIGNTVYLLFNQPCFSFNIVLFI